MWGWRRMEKMNWTDRVKNEEILQSQAREKYPTNKTKGGSLDWSYFAYELLSKNVTGIKT
jgi:hypothetical protein